jgi:hypothetical protein
VHGNGAIGVYGGGTDYGVNGEATATTAVAYGGRFTSSSSSGYGVYGEAQSSTGNTWGVYGRNQSTAGGGVHGVANATSGFTYAVLGENYSTAARGVYGVAYATTSITFGVVGASSSPSGFGVYYQGGLGGSGTKSCVVKTSKGPTLLYCQESPENWFEDFGEGTLMNGRAHVELDPVFLETVTIDAANPMKVFVQPQDMGCKGLAAIPGTTGFDVGELLGGTSSTAFTYRVVAKRQGFEAKRLDVCEAARTDSYLYPELKDKEQAEREAAKPQR